MSKKLLKEATVRKFMKLANISNLSSPFLKEMEYKRDEDLTEEEDLEVGEMEMDAELDAEEPAEEATAEDITRDFAEALQDVAAKHGVDVAVEDDATVDAEPEMGDAPMDDDLIPDDEPEMAEDEDEGMMAEAIMNLLDKSGIEVVDDKAMTESLVKKVAARVARRLLKESL